MHDEDLCLISCSFMLLSQIIHFFNHAFCFPTDHPHILKKKSSLKTATSFTPNWLLPHLSSPPVWCQRTLRHHRLLRAAGRQGELLISKLTIFCFGLGGDEWWTPPFPVSPVSPLPCWLVSPATSGLPGSHWLRVRNVERLDTTLMVVRCGEKIKDISSDFPNNTISIRLSQVHLLRGL